MSGRTTRRRTLNHVRPTREGLGFIIVTVAVLAAAINTGNNLLYLVLACLMGILLVANLLAEWNLRGISIERQLPAEMFAGKTSRGSIIIKNNRRLGTAWTLLVTDRVQGEDQPVAEGRMLRLSPGERRELFLSWRFPRRGDVTLKRVRVESSFPFGLVRRWQELDASVTVLVYPYPDQRQDRTNEGGQGQERSASHKKSRTGQLKGMRKYVHGDPLRDVHWPTSARTRKPMIRLRDGHESMLATVTVDNSRPRELAISEATGSVLGHLSDGRAVGLRIDGSHHSPRNEAAWRHHLLQVLARAPASHP